MTKQFSLDEIRDYWTQQAVKYGASPAASWSDRWMIDLEVRTLLRYLEDGDRVLDVGCGNGYTAALLASQRRVAIRGIDYIPEMIDLAQERLRALPGKLAGTLEFAVGDVTALAEDEAGYDKVIAVRVIINLESWERQRQALFECLRVLRSGGLLVLSEATRQGWEALNKFRYEWGLDEIPMPPFNNYVDQHQIVAALEDFAVPVDVLDFASSYYVGTRVLKPLLAQALKLPIDIADPNMEWNRWCASLPAGGDYGTQKLFVFRKR